MFLCPVMILYIAIQPTQSLYLCIPHYTPYCKDPRSMRGCFIQFNHVDRAPYIYFLSMLPTAAAPHRCLIFGQKWRSVELCRSDRIIRNEESKAGTTIGWNFRVKRLTYQEGLSAAYFRNVSYWPHCYLNFCSSCKNLGNVCFLKANAMFCTNLALHTMHFSAQRCSCMCPMLCFART